MPKRNDIKSILVVGAGPIVIGQACEFDYSGTQACKALKKDGYKIILINSNPATIMTDPNVADKTYIEPITSDILKKIIKKEEKLKIKRIIKNSKFDMIHYFTLCLLFCVAIRVVCLYSLTVRNGEGEIMWLQITQVSSTLRIY